MAASAAEQVGTLGGAPTAPPTAPPTLAHSRFLCPGLHGSAGTDVTAQVFDVILGPDVGVTIDIPLFQRRYCWSERQLVQFWNDIQRASRLSPHHVGKIVFCRAGPDRLICIDGQQRLTSLLLAVAAVRDHALALAAGDLDDAAVARDLVTIANRVLFVDGAEHASRLLPSLEDRAAFGAAMRGDVASGAETAVDRARACLTLLVSAKTGSDATTRARLTRLAAALSALLSSARYVHVEMRTLEHAQQAFLWLAEQSVMGSLLLANATPGVTLRTCDLLRNALMAPWIASGSAAQEFALETLWLPIERRFASPSAFDAALGAFAAARNMAVGQGAGLSAELYAMRENIVHGVKPDWSSFELYLCLNSQWVSPAVVAAGPDSAQRAVTALLAELNAFTAPAC